MNVMHSPRSLDISITSRCNLRCSYCAHFTSAGDVCHDLHAEEWLEFFGELNRCGVMRLCLQGGEPFFREDLPQLIDGVVNNRMRFGVLTNGTLITDEMAKFLASTRRCNSVQVSIDGSGPDTHDSFRGKGSFSRAVEGIERLRRQNIPVSVRVTIHRENVRELDKIARFLLEELKLPRFSTNEACYMGLCRKNAQDIQLTVQEYTFALEAVLRLKKKYNGRITALAGPLANAKNWLEMERARREGIEGLPGRGCLSGCNGFFGNMAVRADGVMVPCITLSHIELGRVNKESLLDIWQNHPELRRLRERRSIPLSDFEFCRGCDYIPFCSGNCPASAYNVVGEENHPGPNACLKRFLDEGGRLPDEEACVLSR